MIIGCDLLKKLSANLNFENELCVMNKTTINTPNDELSPVLRELHWLRIHDIIIF